MFRSKSIFSAFIVFAFCHSSLAIEKPFSGSEKKDKAGATLFKKSFNKLKSATSKTTTRKTAADTAGIQWADCSEIIRMGNENSLQGRVQSLIGIGLEGVWGLDLDLSRRLIPDFKPGERSDGPIMAFRCDQAAVESFVSNQGGDLREALAGVPIFYQGVMEWYEQGKVTDKFPFIASSSESGNQAIFYFREVNGKWDAESKIVQLGLARVGSTELRIRNSKNDILIFGGDFPSDGQVVLKRMIN